MVPTALKGKAGRYISLGDALDAHIGGESSKGRSVCMGRGINNREGAAGYYSFCQKSGAGSSAAIKPKIPQPCILNQKLLLSGVLLESQAIKDKLNKNDEVRKSGGGYRCSGRSVILVPRQRHSGKRRFFLFAGDEGFVTHAFEGSLVYAASFGSND